MEGSCSCLNMIISCEVALIKDLKSKRYDFSIDDILKRRLISGIWK